ncbi:MAG TPA: hypothetical protein VLB80_02740 [Candidatus Babeliales bacterium]|nr:hypothetical protein [Candidatus Babeliales bacterium]
MKKVVYITAFVTVISLSTLIVDAVPTKIHVSSEATLIGQQLIRELGDKIKTTAHNFQLAQGIVEKKEAIRSAKIAAQELLNALNDVKTFGNDVVRGYLPEQIRQAAIALSELLTRRNALDTQIKGKRTEIDEKTIKGWVWDSPMPGQTETRSHAQKQFRELHYKLKDIQIAILEQERILGKEWSNAIKHAINGLLVGTSFGISYGINWYFQGNRARINKGYISGMMRKNEQNMILPKFPDGSMEAKEFNDAIEEWNFIIAQSDIISKDIITASQLNQAKEVLNKMHSLRSKLKNVPKTYKNILDDVASAIDMVANKIERSKNNWLKV